jgi:K+-sensing histidine kinase KdpD
MNVFTWEFVTQLFRLDISKHIKSPLAAIFDCTGAIARTNQALKTKYNQLASTKILDVEFLPLALTNLLYHINRCTSCTHQYTHSSL